jgi:hypothetical protein
MCKRINRVICRHSRFGQSFFAAGFVPHVMDCRHGHRATKRDDANTTCRRFDPNADGVNLQRRLEIDWQFTTAETFN